ncbi:flagellar hook-basal body complex protein FliE [Aquamicrobium terrae]|uniref:Flagellar hook-basal body complex protein FliE n=1 Tax=Aquamicrobium terrae TaxID=1324945 RepID=A0ABV2MY15_9HYPH
MIGPVGALRLTPALGTETARTSSLQDGAVAGSSFADALAQAASRTVGKLENAEQVSLEALKGNADTREVVDAVMSAQQTLQAAVAIRDKIVTAYLEVSRMSI